MDINEINESIESLRAKVDQMKEESKRRIFFNAGLKFALHNFGSVEFKDAPDFDEFNANFDKS